MSVSAGGRPGRRRAGRVRAGAALLLLVLCACGTTARVNRFREFARAGEAYADAADRVYREAGDVAVDTDSALLTRLRERLPEEERAGIVLEHNELIRERLALLEDLRRHARLLQSYFRSLAALAESEGPSAIGEAAGRVVGELEQLGNGVRSRFDQTRLEAFSAGAVTLVMAKVRSAELERELEAHAPLIERHLDLHEAALRVLAEQMRTDLQAMLQMRESSDVVRPYASGALPAGWTGERRRLLTLGRSLETVDAAADAARDLRVSFLALLENRYDVADLELFLEDLGELVSLVETLREPEGGTGTAPVSNEVSSSGSSPQEETNEE
jgi:hypothetical protein